MAAHAVLDVANTFLGMFGADLFGLVLVAAKARVAFEIPTLVARGARGVMWACQRKEAVVVECGGLPTRLAMARRTIIARLCVDRRCWRAVALRASGPDFWT